MLSLMKFFSIIVYAAHEPVLMGSIDQGSRIKKLSVQSWLLSMDQNTYAKMVSRKENKITFALNVDDSL